jgi:hypothetical protein
VLHSWDMDTVVLVCPRYWDGLGLGGLTAYVMAFGCLVCTSSIGNLYGFLRWLASVGGVAEQCGMTICTVHSRLPMCCVIESNYLFDSGPADFHGEHGNARDGFAAAVLYLVHLPGIDSSTWPSAAYMHW